MDNEWNQTQNKLKAYYIQNVFLYKVMDDNVQIIYMQECKSFIYTLCMFTVNLNISVYVCTQQFQIEIDLCTRTAQTCHEGCRKITKTGLAAGTTDTGASV